MPTLPILVLFACAGPGPGATVDPAPALAAPEPESVQRLSLMLIAEDMRYDEAAGTATFSPGSRRMAASYDIYVMDLKTLEAVLGGRVEAPVQVDFEVTSVDRRVFAPDDPELPQPDGGFGHTDWRVVPVAVVPRGD